MKEHKKLTELQLQRAYVLIGALADENVCILHPIVNLYHRKLLKEHEKLMKLFLTRPNAFI